MAQKTERLKLTTPPGTLRWPKLNKINYGSEKFPVKNGNFETEIIIDKDHPEFAAFAAKFDPLYEKAKEFAEAKYADLPVKSRKDLKEKNPPNGIRLRPLIQEMYDEKTEELLSTVKIKLKMGAGGVTKAGKPWMARPTAFSASGKPLPLFINAPGTPHHGKPHPKAKLIYTGTLARVAFDIELSDFGFYFAAVDGAFGLRANLAAVQILKYGDAPQRGADAYGFGSEDGYDGEDVDDSWDESDFDQTSPTSEGSGGGSGGDNGGDF